MRNLDQEVLKDILYNILKQCIPAPSTLRMGSDVVYYQSGEDYHTLCLTNDNGQYTLYHKTQNYSGDIIYEKRHDFKQPDVTSMYLLHYISKNIIPLII